MVTGRAGSYRRRLASSPALTMMTATGGMNMAATDITTAAVTENLPTTVHASATRTMHAPIRAKYARLRVTGMPAGSRPRAAPRW